jgi:hypothetical protein
MIPVLVWGVAPEYALLLVSLKVPPPVYTVDTTMRLTLPSVGIPVIVATDEADPFAVAVLITENLGVES